MLASDIRDVTATNTDIIQLAAAQTLQLGIGAIVLGRAGAVFFYLLDELCKARSEIEAAMCKSCRMCQIFVPFCTEAYSPGVSIRSFRDKAQIGSIDTANNKDFGLAGLHQRHSKEKAAVFSTLGVRSDF